MEAYGGMCIEAFVCPAGRRQACCPHHGTSCTCDLFDESSAPFVSCRSQRKPAAFIPYDSHAIV
eukprot:365520-Chlamydomonas_euryale.AAC.8